MSRLLCAMRRHRLGPMVDRKARCRCGRSWEFVLVHRPPDYQSFAIQPPAPPEHQ